MQKLSIKDLNLSNKRILLRVDFNVPLTPDGKIADDFRILSSLPTIQYILNAGGSIVLMSHLGSPKGKKDPKLSLSICAKRLSELLKQDVKMAPDSVGKEVESLSKNLKSREILMLENLRFYGAEEKPESDPFFAKSLSLLGEIYVNDAFGTAHRKHSSTYTITSYFPNRSLMGLLMEKEVKYFSEMTLHPKRPFFAILAGSKISTKLKVIEKLLEKVDALFLGGAMSFTFFKAQNFSMGKSLVEDDYLLSAKNILLTCREKKIPLYLPEDIVITEEIKKDSITKTIIPSEGIPSNWEGVDIGNKTFQAWKNHLLKAKTIFWNGPVGVFEIPTFAKGTQLLAHFLSTLKDVTTIVGGGDSAAAIRQMNLDKKFSHISTGGGASLEWIEEGSLPGVDALSDKAL